MREEPLADEGAISVGADGLDQLLNDQKGLTNEVLPMRPSCISSIASSGGVIASVVIDRANPITFRLSLQVQRQGNRLKVPLGEGVEDVENYSTGVFVCVF
jgi:hypothetical protein